MVVDFGLEAIVRVDRVSGERTIISAVGTGSGPGFVTPRGIAVESDGSLVVIDFGLEAVVRVDQFSGDRTIISGCQHRQWPVKQLAPARSYR